MERSGVQGDLGPVLNEEQDPQIWIDEPGSPVAEPAGERGTPETVSHDELIQTWAASEQ